jgi:hypothetical protein
MGAPFFARSVREGWEGTVVCSAKKQQQNSSLRYEMTNRVLRNYKSKIKREK